MSLSVFISSNSSPQVFAQEISEEEPEFLMGILILESQQQMILESIKKVKDLNLGNMVILHPMDQDWNLTLVEEAIREADNLGLYTIFETYNCSDHKIRISPEQFESWKAKYPHLLGILVQEVTGKQIDLKLWQNNSTVTIKTRIEAEQAIIQNITTSMHLPEFKDKGAKIFLQENVISYASANTTFCDVLIAKVFNAPNTELMIGLTRGMVDTFEIPAWGLWVDTWREWKLPPAFTPNDVERALYEGWFYGAKYFFFEQGNFFGTFDRNWPNKYILLDQDGTLTEYGKVLQKFYTFLQNQNNLEFDQPNYESPIAVMIGQSGWCGRGSNWGLWNQSDRQGDFDYRFLNLFFPGIGDNWQIAYALTGKHFTGLPFGMVDIISIYAPPSVMKQYNVIIALGWNQLTDIIATNIEEYVNDGGIFFSLITFTHGSNVDDLENPHAWTSNFTSLFGVQVASYIDKSDNSLAINADLFLKKVTFTQDTFWYPWNGRIYDYVSSEGTGTWFWKYNYTLSEGKENRVIAWINGIQSNATAFIIENRIGDGYTYVVNTRNSQSLPDGTNNNIVREFIYALCAYYKRPMTFSAYPQNEYWISQGQADNVIYLIHDNQTDTEPFTYHIKPQEAALSADRKYLIFEYLNRELYKSFQGLEIDLAVDLKTNESKLFLLLDDTGEPKVLTSDTIQLDPPVFSSQELILSQQGIEQSKNNTLIYCSNYRIPKYILGSPYDLRRDYNQENNMLSIFSESDIVVSWKNTHNISIAASTDQLTEVSFNSTLETLTLAINGAVGQDASILVDTGGNTPYFLSVDGKEISTWNYDNSTDLLLINYSFTDNNVELVVGFNPIVVDQIFVSDERVDVGSVQIVGFHLSWMSNNSNVVGVFVYVDGSEYVTNKSGWAIFDVKQHNVGRIEWNISGVKCDEIINFSKSITDPVIIWDRIEIANSIFSNDPVQKGSSQKIWLTAVYEYDSIVFDDSKGIIYLDGEPMTWSKENLRWEKTVTSDAIGLQEYEVLFVKDEVYGLKAINTKDTIRIIWDELEIVKTDFETDTLGITNVIVSVSYRYSEQPVEDAKISVNNIVCNKNGQGIYKGTIKSWSPLQNYVIRVESVKFRQITQNKISLQFFNAILYGFIGLVFAVTLTYFILKRKKERKMTEY